MTTKKPRIDHKWDARLPLSKEERELIEKAATKARYPLKTWMRAVLLVHAESVVSGKA